jgi:signal transduction histidine kinase
MSEQNTLGGLSFSQRGAKAQFAVGIGLVSIIPLLGLWYLFSVSQDHSWVVLGLPDLLVTFTLLLGAAAGVFILRRYASSIVRLRRYTDEIVSGHLPAHVSIPRSGNDVEAIERGMNAIVDTLRARLATAEQEKAQLEKQLLEADKLRSLGLVAGGVAHDFGNIMCVVTGSAQLAQMTLHDTARTREFLQAISGAAQQAADLTQQMLAMASGHRAERGRVNVGTAIGQIADLLRSSAGSSNKVQLSLDNEVWVDRADVTQIRQVVLNLVFNAADAMNSPGAITITVRRMRFAAEDLAGLHPPEHAVGGSYACIEVADTGCGMDEAARRHIFDAFYTTKMGGRGLGLSVVLGIVRSHAGLVGVVASEPGTGTTFRVLLPCHPPAS